jgi:hypothetical protein
VHVTLHVVHQVWWNHIQAPATTVQRGTTNRTLIHVRKSGELWINHTQKGKMIRFYWPSGFAMKLRTRLMKFPKIFTNSLLSLACKSAQVNCVSDAWKLEQKIFFFTHNDLHQDLLVEWILHLTSGRLVSM